MLDVRSTLAYERCSNEQRSLASSFLSLSTCQLALVMSPATRIPVKQFLYCCSCSCCQTFLV